MFRGRVKNLHFVGIGGVGMCGIAEVLVNLGYEVSGSDLRESQTVKRLKDLGARVEIGHAEDNVWEADVVITSTAIGGDNPEVRAARKRGIPVIRRAEMLAELMRLKYGIAVAGTHGKTTTTSLTSAVLAEGGIDPTIVIGGKLKSISSNARLGDGEYLVAEADESDGSFLKLMPTIGVVTNIDEEHLDHWHGGIDEIEEAFINFVNKVPFYGCAVMCLDHPRVQSILPKIERKILTYGLSPQADYAASNVMAREDGVDFTVRRHGDELGRVELAMIGVHNVQNALAAIAVADEIGVDFSAIQKALAEFEGISRRFEEKGRFGDVVVVDDYGHHPEEILATLRAARASSNRRLVVAFQPHRYTRTRDLMDEFAKSFNACHELVLADVYAAGEVPIIDADSKKMVEKIRDFGHHGVRYGGDLDGVLRVLQEVVEPGDMVITLGAGDIYKVGERLLETMGEGSFR